MKTEKVVSLAEYKSELGRNRWQLDASNKLALASQYLRDAEQLRMEDIEVMFGDISEIISNVCSEIARIYYDGCTDPLACLSGAICHLEDWVDFREDHLAQFR
ncbi:hypothetical protein [Microbulbifer hydrolyticus]|uniref:Nucleotide pyrophosphohydrolase n=1 Tax=Microbulbifer hydrolyticus TaxID=48074 RepID=A0A6P1TF12_9GAMM|nr:hypothetical protein [Microbulbifer hydrolyticus]MBB5212618.1 hypothetical protein [Microbulbifer hydrolyticus]QHQ40225.1 hypothetical protein GTQ55_15390 [Microbulbifer hydrolyticus]